MALIKCSNCGKDISDTTSECIHCGTPIKKEIVEVPAKKSNTTKIVVAVVIGVVVLAVLGVVALGFLIFAFF